MGQTILTCARREPARFDVAAQIDLGDDPAAALEKCAAAIDFSSAAGTGPLLEACRAQGNKPLVIGATGHDEAQRAQIHAASREMPIVWAANFSVGVNALFWLTRQAAAILGPGFDLEVVEVHHRLKKDAPSGTARRLAEILAEARNVSYDKDTRHGREGMVGERTNEEIGVHAVRGGDVVGEHTVLFAGMGERVELIHRATSRETFAMGALRAAEWLPGHPAGLYDMEDVLGLRAAR
jgi:4-hydroxy-tetrahydrodipicolinate reductase